MALDHQHRTAIEGTELVLAHIERDHHGMSVLDADWRQHPFMAHEADHRAHGIWHDRLACEHNQTGPHGTVGKDWCPGPMSRLLEPWRQQLVFQMNAVPLVKDDDDRAQVAVNIEVLNEICAVLGFVSLGREHVRQHWHLAPDATARRLLGVLRD